MLAQLGTSRVAQAFSVIAGFPLSLPAIEDLHKTIQAKPALKEALVQSLQQGQQKHFLSHAATLPTNAALTRKMIQFLIQAILALYYLDKTGYILELTQSPLIQCLK